MERKHSARLLWLIAIGLAVGVFGLAGSAQAATYYVNDGSTTGDVFCSAVGNDLNSGLAPNLPKATVQSVLTNYALGAGDFVLIDTGVYTLTASIEVTAADEGASLNEVNFFGSGTLAGTVINGNGAATYGFYFNGSSHFWLQDIRITGATSHGIHCLNGDDITLRNVVCDNNGGNGINFDGYTNGDIANLTCYKNGGRAVNFVNTSTSGSIADSILWADGAGNYCIYVENGSQSGYSSNYNCVTVSASAQVGSWAGSAAAALANWQGLTGNDLNSISDNPLFRDPDNANPLLADFHLKSQGGHIEAGGAVTDTVTSPCIDAGDPGPGVLNETSPNGQIANQGAYGNTAKASRSVVYLHIQSTGVAGVAVTGTYGGVTPMDVQVLDGANVTITVPYDAGTAGYRFIRWKDLANQTITTTPSYVTDINVETTIRAEYLVRTSFYVNDGNTAGDYYCSAVGDDNNLGTSAGAPLLNLSTLLARYDLAAKDKVYVDTGVYTLAPATAITITATQSGSAGAGNEVQFIGAPEDGGTLIDANGATQHGIYVDGANYLIIKGIDVTGALSHGIHINASTESDVTSLTCYSNGDDGVHFTNSPTGSVTEVRARNNTGDGVEFDGSINGTVQNVISYSNGGLGLQFTNSATGGSVVNSTIYQNTGNEIGFYSSSSGGEVDNTIVWADGAGDYGIVAVVGALMTAAQSDYNDLYVTNGAQVGQWSGIDCSTLAFWQATAATDDTHSISSDPLFVNAAGGDFHLQSMAGHWTAGGTFVVDGAMSPCVPAGDPASSYANETAPDGNVINQGAYGNTKYASRDGFTLNVQSTPPTSLNITSSTSHGGTTNYNLIVERNAAVNLQAPANGAVGLTDYVFDHWELDTVPQGASQTLNFNMDTSANRTAVAVYVIVTRQLQVFSTVESAYRDGCVIASGTGHGGTTAYTITAVPDHDSVSLTAPATSMTAGVLQEFQGWKLDGAGKGTGTLSFYMDAPHIVIAEYSIANHNLYVHSTPVQGIPIGGSDPGTTDYTAVIPDGTAASLTALATHSVGNVDYHWVMWNVDSGAMTQTARTLSWVAVTAPHDALAVYEQDAHTLTVRSTGVDAVDINKPVTSHPGTTTYTVAPTPLDDTPITLTAWPMWSVNEGTGVGTGSTINKYNYNSLTDYEFQNWDSNGTPLAAGVNTLTFRIQEATTATAVYQRVARTLSVTSKPVSDVNITGTYNQRTNQALSRYTIKPGQPDGYVDYWGFEVQPGDNLAITLTAPAQVGNYRFQYWREWHPVWNSTDLRWEFTDSACTVLTYELSYSFRINQEDLYYEAVYSNSAQAFYVNDASTLTDVYCHDNGAPSSFNNPGDDANSGTQPWEPKATIQAVIRDYDLRAGDRIYVDTGVYTLTSAITITAADQGSAGAGNDVAFIGSTAVTGTAINANNAADYGFHPQVANYVSFERFNIFNSKKSGVFFDNCIGGKVATSTVFANAERGVYIKDGANGALRNVVVHSNTGAGIEFDNSMAGHVTNVTAYGNGGSALVLRNISTDAILRNNIIWGKGAGNYAVSLTSDSLTGLNSDYNNFFASGSATLTAYQGADCVSLTAWQSKSSQDYHSISQDPLFLDPDNANVWLRDYHVQAIAGHWTTLSGWVLDSYNSPCLDKGDTSYSYAAEPAPNGLHINLGAYGNTDQASKSAHTLTVTSLPFNAVTITGSLGAISTTYATRVNGYDAVTLTAPATTTTALGQGYHFVEWQTDGVSATTLTTLTFDMDWAHTVTAVYEVDASSLTVLSATVTGVAITTTYTGVSPYTATTPYGLALTQSASLAVTLTAPAATVTVGGADYHFMKWDLDTVGQPAGVVTLTFTMNTAHTATAVYDIDTHALTVQSSPATGANITGSQPGTTNYPATVPDNSTVNLTAPYTFTAGAATYRFLNWWKSVGGDQAAGQRNLSFTMDADLTVVAKYELYVTYGLTVQSSPVTGVSISGSQPGATNYSRTLEQGTAVNLIAPASFTTGGSNYQFSYWKLDGAPQATGVSTLAFTMNSAHSAEAVYTYVPPPPNTLTVQSTPITGVSISGTHSGTTNYTASVTGGSTVSLSAPWEVGAYRFVRWKTSSGSTLSRKGTYSFSMTSNTTVIAEYAAGLTTFYVNDSSTSNDVYCSAVGNDANSGTSPAAPKASVQGVISAYALQPGARVYIDTGTYQISSSIEITASDDGSSGTGNDVAFIGSTHSDGTLIDGNNQATHGFYANGANYVTIQNVRVKRASQHGIYFRTETGGVVENVTAYSNGQSGIYFEQATHGSVSHAVSFDNGADGICFSNMSSYGAVSQATSYGNGGDAIAFRYSCTGGSMSDSIACADGSGSHALYVHETAQSGMSSDYNDLYASGGARVGYWGGIHYDLASWQSASSQDANSISDDPLFVDPTNSNRALRDYHLKSEAGHWTASGWVVDGATSPCIDAGNPSSAYSTEPSPNGSRANLGAYGNTAQASKTGGGVPPTPGVTELTNGVALTGLSGAKSSETHYKLAVPSGASSLEFKIWGGTGDVDLYVKFGAQASSTNWDYRPYKSGNNETVTVASPAAGDWYVMLRAYHAYTGVSLQGTYIASGGQLAAPTNVTATDGAYADRVRVTWTGSAGASGYEVYRATSSSSASSSLIGTTSSTTYDDGSATSGTTYWYWVKAKSSSLFSSFSNGDSGYAGSSQPSPGVTELTNGVPVSSIAGAQASETHYKIAVPAGGTSLAIQTSGGTGDVDIYVNYGQQASMTSYDYRPYKSGNNELVTVAAPQSGDWYIMLRGYRAYTGVSLVASYQTPGDQLLPPSDVSATDGDYTDKVRVSWTASSGVTSYQVYRAGSNNSSAASLLGSSIGSTYDDTSAVSGSTYYYWVKAVSSTQTSAFSSSDSGYCGGTPSSDVTELENGVPVTNLAAAKSSQTHYKIAVDAGATNLVIKTWGGAGDCDLYVKFGAKAGVTSWDYRPYKSGNNETVTIAVPQQGDYYVMLRGYRAYTGVSLQASYEVHGGQFPPPTNVAATDGTYADKVRVTWSAATGASSYDIYRATTDSSAVASVIGSTTSTSYDDTSAAPGTLYYYWLKAKQGAETSSLSSSDSGYAGSAPQTEATELHSGEPVSDLSGAKASETHYFITVPAGASSLAIQTSGGSGDCDIYVKFGAQPSTTDWDYRPYKSGNNELVSINNPTAGDWYIMVRGYRVYAGVTIEAVYQTETTGLQPPTNVAATDGDYADKVKVTWTAAAGASSYAVYRANSSSNAAATLLGTTAATSLDDASAALNTTYWYWVRSQSSSYTSAFSAGDTGYAGSMPDSTVTDLQSGSPLTGLSGAKKTTADYRIAVAAGSTQLVAQITGGTGDCDLYVRFGDKATKSHFDYRPYKVGNEETVTVSNPQAGDWYIMLRAFSAYAGVTLQATTQP